MRLYMPSGRNPPSDCFFSTTKQHTPVNHGYTYNGLTWWPVSDLGYVKPADIEQQKKYSIDWKWYLKRFCPIILRKSRYFSIVIKNTLYTRIKLFFPNKSCKRQVMNVFEFKWWVYFHEGKTVKLDECEFQCVARTGQWLAANAIFCCWGDFFEWVCTVCDASSGSHEMHSSKVYCNGFSLL